MYTHTHICTYEIEGICWHRFCTFLLHPILSLEGNVIVREKCPICVCICLCVCERETIIWIFLSAVSNAPG